MSTYEEQTSVIDVNFDVFGEERIRSFLEQFAPEYKGYLLDQTPKQMHSREFTIRIYFQNHSSVTLTCDSADMLKKRVQNIININREVRFTNADPDIEKHTFSVNNYGKEDTVVYYTATMEFDFTKL